MSSRAQAAIRAAGCGANGIAESGPVSRAIGASSASIARLSSPMTKTRGSDASSSSRDARSASMIVVTPGHRSPWGSHPQRHRVIKCGFDVAIDRVGVVSQAGAIDRRSEPDDRVTAEPDVTSSRGR